MFSETRYALNGDLRVAYRASREGPRDIVFVPNWSTCCELLPELPSLQGWVEAMTSLGRLIFFDQPGTGASDPVTPGALPTLEQWADSITAVLDDVGSREAVLLAFDGAFATGALFAATHPSNTIALVVLEGYANQTMERTDGFDSEEAIAVSVATWGTGEFQHVLIPDMPWNEEIRAAWAREERLSVSPATVALMVPLVSEVDVRAVLPTVRVPTLVVQHTDDPVVPPEWGKYIADHVPEAIREAVQALGIEVRTGLHTGECEDRGDDIGGIAVHIGARVSALGGPNDVLVSSTLRDLVIGSGLEFDDRGAHELRGVPGEWHLLAVASP